MGNAQLCVAPCEHALCSSIGDGAAARPRVAAGGAYALDTVRVYRTPLAPAARSLLACSPLLHPIALSIPSTHGRDHASSPLLPGLNRSCPN